MKKNKEFRIGVYEEQSGFIIIRAKSKKEAEKNVLRILENEGLSGYGNDLEVCHREVNLLN